MSVAVRPYRRVLDNGGLSIGWQLDIRTILPDGSKHRERIKSPLSSKEDSIRYGEEREAYLRQYGNRVRTEVEVSLDALESKLLSRQVDSQTTTYFISQGRFVKIGRARNVDDRLRTLQTGSPIELVLECALVGDHEDELHRFFYETRVRGEWFTLTPAMEAWINRVKTSPRLASVDYARWLKAGAKEVARLLSSREAS